MSSTFDLEREIIEGVAREAQRLCADIDRWQPGSELASTLDSCARAIRRCLAEIDAGEPTANGLNVLRRNSA